MNAIWYRFYSEKDSYEIRFDTTEMSIGDIKKKIIQRRNMLKYPENFDLIFCDEENSKELEDKDLVKPMKHLIIKRFPHYKRENNFVQLVRDPRDILMNKINENGLRRGEPQKIVRYIDPLEKITKKLDKEMINNQFKCRICKNTDEETLFNPVISKCCKETFCLKCYNKDESQCPICHNSKVGYVKNESVANLAKKLLEILAKKEEQEKLLKEAALKKMNISFAQRANNLPNLNDIGNNKPININNNDINPNNDNPNNKFNMSGNNLVNQNIDPSNFYQFQNQNPCFSLIEGSQFFIIKSSNKENIEKSKKNSVWATTASNSKKLNEAFNKGKVILIFSVNGTQTFQGYAIMTSFSSDSPSNLWQIENNIRLGGDFSVVWLCFCELNFTKAKHLQNPKKNGEPVTKSRDSTELSQNIGYELCKLCYEQEKQELIKNPQQPKVQINEKLIEKINEEIKNNKNKQSKKNNNRANNNNEQNENSSNNNKIAENLNNTSNNINPAPIPNTLPNTMMPMVSPFYMFQNYIYYRNMNPYLQMHQQDTNNSNTLIPGMINQQQPKQDNDNNDKNKKDKEKNRDRERDRDRDRDKDRKNKKDDKKYIPRHNKDRSRRRRSRSRDRSRSRSRNKSRSSRRSNSDSSKSEGRSKYSKSRK